VRFAALLFCAITLAACENAPVRWKTANELASAPPAGAALVIGRAGQAMFVPSPIVPITLPPQACAHSLVMTRLYGREWYAAWWQIRADSSAMLVVARSLDDGRSWGDPAVADARDRAVVGCARPAPSIASDSATGYVHLAYSLDPAEGAGVWFTHSMEHGDIWHAPVGILYGGDFARTSIAASGDTVVVAYEYPLASDARIGLAVSFTDGHIFDFNVPVSGADEATSHPRVALSGRTIAVAWQLRAPDSGDRKPAAITMLRVGEIQ